MEAESKASVVDPNRLWVHLSGFADGNIFAIYPKILEEMFVREEERRRDQDEQLRHEIESITLPSDMEWRLKAYFQLVAKQREMDDTPAESPALEKLRAARRWSRPDSAASADPWSQLGALAMGATAKQKKPPPSATLAFRAKAASRLRRRDPPWGARDLAKAARLLERPPPPSSPPSTPPPGLAVRFDDDQEMRRVYSLIYDVFRYKCVLEEALFDTGFYTTFPQALERKSLAWLLLFDQQRRRWAKRDLTSDDAEVPPPREAVRSRSRSRRKSSLKSRSSSGESSRRPSLSSLEGRLSRSSHRWKAAVAAREEEVRSPEARSKWDLVRPDNADDTDDTITEEDGAEEMVSDGGSERSRSLTRPQQPAAEDLDYSVTRNEMRDAMERAAGEIGHIVKNFDIVLWDHRVRIAAAIAKIRIRNKALTLSELLPPHLRDERVTAASKRDVMTGWVNVFKSRSINELVQRMNEMGFSYSTTRTLEPNQFRFDRICPKFISVRPMLRTEFVRSSMLSENVIILQEREFCLGAAALCRAMKNAQLHGDVAQTHGTSPKAAAYLAARLKDDWPEHRVRLIVFGTGDRKPEYDQFLKALGATNAEVVAEGAREGCAALWAGVVAALAAPPNSYSAVADPIDLVCSRGGDLRMLEALTESEMGEEETTRVMRILDEQKKILRFCMSKPQIQMIVYETHSSLSAENGDMVRRAVSEANRAARELHSIRKKQARDAAPKTPKCANVAQPMETGESGDELEALTEPSSPIKLNMNDANIFPEPKQELELNIEQDVSEITEKPPSPKLDENALQIPIVSAQASPHTGHSQSSPTDPDSELSDVKVPDCDLFEDEFPYTFLGMSAHDRNACFLALIKRKELIRMNAKYMINVAETRGLFGGSSPPPKKPPPAKKKTEEVQKVKQSKRILTKSEIDRIAAPTHAWSARVGACSACGDRESVEDVICTPCARRNFASGLPRARFWWRLAIRHVASNLSPPLYLPRGTTGLRNRQMQLPVAKPRFDAAPETPHFGCALYARMLEAVGDM